MFPRRALARLVALTMVAACVWPWAATTAWAESPAPAPHYEIRAAINVDTAALTAVQTIDYVNSTGVPLGVLAFNVPAAYFGGFSLAEVTVDGAAARHTMEKQSLDVPLARPLPPGGHTTVVLSFRLQAPPGDGRYGVAMGVIALGDWYPILAVYRDGWQRVAYSDIGDPYFSAVANYDVYVTTSAPALVAASGYPVSHDSRNWHYRARNARDFALGISRGYAFMTRDVGGTIVTIAHLPEHASGAARMLEIASDSLRWYGTVVGQYPYSHLTVAETVAERPAHTAQEHSGLIFMRSDIVEYNSLLLEMLTAHEVAHQWFFGVVGNDQLREPWMDEGMVNALALDYFRQRDAEDFKELWDLWGNYTSTGQLNRSIYDFPRGTSYFDEVYRGGATFISDLQQLMGPEVFYRTLREYYAENQFGIASSDELLARMRAASATDPLEFYRRTFNYAYLSAPNPEVTVTVPSSIVAGSAVTFPVTTEPPASRLRATLDGTAVPLAAGARSVVVQPTQGEHTLVVEALGPGVGYSRRTEVFAAARPAPAPTPLPTAVPRPTAAPVVPLSPQPLPEPRAADAREVAWAMIALLGAAAAGGVASAAMRSRIDRQ